MTLNVRTETMFCLATFSSGIALADRIERQYALRPRFSPWENGIAIED